MVEAESWGPFDLRDESIWDGRSLFYLRGLWTQSGVSYEGVTSIFPRPTLYKSLGSKELTKTDLKNICEQVVSTIEGITAHDENTKGFRNKLSDAKASGAEFARKILTVDAARFLYESLRTEGSLVVLLVHKELKGVPWELCFLGSGSSGGFVNQLGRFERCLSVAQLSDDQAMQGNGITFIVDSELTIDKVTNKVVDTLEGKGVVDIYNVEVIEEFNEIFAQSDRIVYLGHHTPKGIRLSEGLCYEPRMLSVCPFPLGGSCLIASCRHPSSKSTGIDDIFKHNELQTLIADQCGCNVIYPLINIPLEKGLVIAASWYKSLNANVYATLWDAWRNVKQEVASSYLWFFSMHGTWAKKID